MSGLRTAIAEELVVPAWPAVDAAVGAIRARHGTALAAVLFYGSCLRDRVDEGRLLDFYVFTDSYRDFHGWSLAALLNRVLPPNVYFLETPFDGRTVRAKYAVLSLAALRRQTDRHALLPTLWARLAQPCTLLYAREPDVAQQATEALASSIATVIGETAPLLPPRFSPAELWTRAFSETYRTELRPERRNRPAQLYGHGPARYDALTRRAVADGLVAGCSLSQDGAVDGDFSPGVRRRISRRWAARRVAGRIVHVLRLAKATLTFTDGLDYALWKIGTHSGVTVRATDWQRRHPLFAAPLLAWRLYRRGAFR